MKLFTIGFTQKTAQQFFELLEKNGVERIVDIRLHPDGQLAGFSKKGDLGYFLKQLIGCDYVHSIQLAPTEEIMKTYHRDKDWSKLETSFQALLDQRGIPETLDRSLFEEKTCCLLCSEAKPAQCHRRLVAERLAQTWNRSGGSSPGVNYLRTDRQPASSSPHRRQRAANRRFGRMSSRWGQKYHPAG